MKRTLKQYIALTERSPASIGEEINQLRQTVEGWLKRNTPIIIICSHKDDYKTIDECYSHRPIYKKESKQ